jgi:hypothetical protein
MADVVDGVVARHPLLLQQIGGMGLTLGEDRDQHVGARHLVAARRLRANDGALDHPLVAAIENFSVGPGAPFVVEPFMLTSQSARQSALNVATKFLDRSSSFLLALGVVMCLESLYTIEWSFPYCSSQEDGPAAALFGMPFPYIRWGGASSLEYDFMPLVCALNVLALLALVWPLTRRLLRSFGERRSGIRIALGSIGLALALFVFAGIASLIGVGAWQPTASIRLYGQDTYFDLRPLRFMRIDLHYECTPSQAWFPHR